MRRIHLDRGSLAYNPAGVCIAYTDYEDYDISVQVYVNLEKYRIVYEYLGRETDHYDTEQYNSIEEMLPVLEYLDFDALVCLPDYLLGD